MKVLMATDGSQPAETALELVGSIAWPAGSEIRLVTALEPIEPVMTAAWAPSLATDVDKQQRDLSVSAEAVLGHAARALAHTGATITTDVLDGRAASAILDEARLLEADLIVLGSRGHGTIGSMLLGSVSAEVADHSPCPVLIARRPHLTRVVLGQDGSDCARVAEEIVAGWPIFAGTAIEVTSVAYLGMPWTSGLALASYEAIPDDYSSVGRQIIAEHQQLVDGCVQRLANAGRRASGRVCEGEAAAGLIEVAEQVQADAIVVGTHGRTGLSRLVIGSIARNVMLHASCSVLIARRGGVARAAHSPA
jgi:nucleotide-binding universal stress UspA family protein